MRKEIAFVGVFVLAFCCELFGQGAAWDDIGGGNSDLSTALVHRDNPKHIYFGSGRGVFKTEDGGLSWRNILSVRGQNRKVNYLLFSAQDKNSLYAATGNGLFYSANLGGDWRKIFRGKDFLEEECTALAVLPYGIYLGTKGGLFVSRDNGRSWHKEAAKLGSSHILTVASSLKEPDTLYAACRDAVFKSGDSGKSWEIIFLAKPAQDRPEAEEMDDNGDEEEGSFCVRYISLDADNAGHIYLATSRGVYFSRNKGKDWERLSSLGLLNRDVIFLLVSGESPVYSVTKSGAFEYSNERWQDISLGLASSHIRSLARDASGGLYAACDNGLFKASPGDFLNTASGGGEPFYNRGEAGINEVQQAAIRYAEVEPGKIQEWRRKAKMKAILPKLTVGIDNSQDTNYEIYTSSTASYAYEGPCDRSRGWDVSLSWELGDLIWSEAQTSIDARSRLMVQLRGDVLDEVTKLYFERLRVKMELGGVKIEDRKKRYEKELRLRELTAHLDALTGGYFSRRSKEILP